jgi:hypothetical protein
MSDPERTWQEVAAEMSAEQDPQRMMRLAEELTSAFERDDATRARPNKPSSRISKYRHGGAQFQSCSEVREPNSG